MSFLITKVEVFDFRNYQTFEFEPSRQVSIFIGDNATGKTNLIEIIQLLISGYSFRRPGIGETIREGRPSSKILMEIENKEEKRKSEIEIDFNQQGKSILVNGNKKRPHALSLLNHVLFVPDDLDVVKGSAERRREAIDGVGIQLSATYHKIKQDYEKIVKQRNALLKDEQAPHYLFETWTESLVDVGSLFFEQREKLFLRIRERFLEIYPLLKKEEKVDAQYVPSWNELCEGLPSKEAFTRALATRADEERARRATLVGPHRDDIMFLVDGRNARKFGSQGQQRTIVLAWKLAEVEILKSLSGDNPVLLLDDVMSELDGQRREALLSFILKHGIQTFITTTHRNYFTPELLEEATIVELA